MIRSASLTLPFRHGGSAASANLGVEVNRLSALRADAEARFGSAWGGFLGHLGRAVRARSVGVAVSASSAKMAMDPGFEDRGVGRFEFLGRRLRRRGRSRAVRHGDNPPAIGAFAVLGPIDRADFQSTSARTGKADEAVVGGQLVAGSTLPDQADLGRAPGAGDVLDARGRHFQGLATPTIRQRHPVAVPTVEGLEESWEKTKPMGPTLTPSTRPASARPSPTVSSSLRAESRCSGSPTGTLRDRA